MRNAMSFNRLLAKQNYVLFIVANQALTHAKRSICRAKFPHDARFHFNGNLITKPSLREYDYYTHSSTMASNATTSESQTGSKKVNRLINERSPYLLQHAHNPVDWYPWGPEAFQKAQQDNKPVFLSIGYSTCHWCHVMEHESFENEDVAKVLNETFVCIKLDREERPDIDKIYMAYVQKTTGSGGWPLSLFLTPTLEPVFGGTYFPPYDAFGRIGFKSLCQLVGKQWEDQHINLCKEAKDAIIIVQAEINQKLTARATRIPSREAWMRCFQQMSKSYDVDYGGFAPSPKFPQTSIFTFLYHMFHRNQNNFDGVKAFDMCATTLKRMAYGGIHDHVGSGFARYSVDKMWHVPHFEKMLYDQAQLVASYIDAFTISRDSFFADVAEDILKYVGRDLSHKQGGFYGAEDADSLPTPDADKKREGAFYTWTYDEVKQLITDEADFALFSFHYQVEMDGNVDPNVDFHKEFVKQNILCCSGTYKETAGKFQMSVDEVQKVLGKCCEILYKAREARPRPSLDIKIVTAWNGLMITGYAKAGFALKNEQYIERAVKAATFIKERLRAEDGTLIRCVYGENDNILAAAKPIGGFLDDYAFVIRGLIDLYEATLDTAWLEWAEQLQDLQDEEFWDKENFGYYNSGAADEYAIIRDKEDQDGAEPSGNSVAAYNLMRLTHYLDRKDFQEKAEQIFRGFSDRLRMVPFSVPEMSAALIYYNATPTQVFIAGKLNAADTEAFLDVVRKVYIPGRLLVVADGEDGKASLLYKRHKNLANILPVHGTAAAYVCRNFTCSLPVTKPEQLEKILDAEGNAKDKSGADSSTSDSD